MKKTLYILTLIFVLTGCVTDQLTAQYDACNNYQRWLDRAQCQDTIAVNDWRMTQDATGQEIMTYRKLLIEKVEANKMTDTEADYAFQKKNGEINQRLAQHRALDQLSQPVGIQAIPQPQYNFSPMLRTSHPSVQCTSSALGNQVYTNCH